MNSSTSEINSSIFYEEIGLIEDLNEKSLDEFNFQIVYEILCLKNLQLFKISKKLEKVEKLFDIKYSLNSLIKIAQKKYYSIFKERIFKQYLINFDNSLLDFLGEKKIIQKPNNNYGINYDTMTNEKEYSYNNKANLDNEYSYEDKIFGDKNFYKSVIPEKTKQRYFYDSIFWKNEHLPSSESDLSSFHEDVKHREYLPYKNFSYSKSNPIENVTKDTLFTLVNSDFIYFQNCEETKNTAFDIIFILLNLNFITDMNYISTIFIKICSLLKKEHEFMYIDRLSKMLEKIEKTNIKKWSNITLNERLNLLKLLNSELNTLERIIKSNKISDPINYLKTIDIQVNNKIAKKINESEVSAMNERIDIQQKEHMDLKAKVNKNEIIVNPMNNIYDHPNKSCNKTHEVNFIHEKEINQISKNSLEKNEEKNHLRSNKISSNNLTHEDIIIRGNNITEIINNKSHDIKQDISLDKNTSLFSKYSAFMNYSQADFKKKIKEEICTTKILDTYVNLRIESEMIEKKIEKKLFSIELITCQNSEIEMMYLYLFKKILERIDQLVFDKCSSSLNSSSAYLKEKYFFLLFRTQTFSDYILKEFKIKSNFMLIENKAIFIDKLTKIGNFLFRYLLENENLKFLNFSNIGEFTKLSKNIFNLGSISQMIDIKDEQFKAEELNSLEKLDIKKFFLPYYNLRKKITVVIEKIKEKIFFSLESLQIEKNDYECYEPFMANSLNYSNFYNVNLTESSEIYLNFNIYRIKSKTILHDIVRQTEKNFSIIKEIKNKIVIDKENGTLHIFLKVEKIIMQTLFSFNVYISFNSQDCFLYDNLLNYIEYDVNILYLFRILKFFFIQRNMFYTFSSVFSNERNYHKYLLFDNISLLSLIIVFFIDSGIIPYQESNFIFKKFYCQRIGKTDGKKDLNINEYEYLFPFLIIDKKQNESSSKSRKTYKLGNLFINFCYFLLNLIKKSREIKKEDDELPCLIINIKQLIIKTNFDKNQFIILSGLEHFCNTINLSEKNTQSISNEYLENKKKNPILNQKSYESFAKSFKTENRGYDLLISFNKEKIEMLEKQIIRCLHYFMKEEDEHFLKAFFKKEDFE